MTTPIAVLTRSRSTEQADDYVADLEMRLMYAIRKKVKSMGWSQTYAAEIMDTHQPKISGIVYGDRTAALDSEGNHLPVARMSLERLIRAAFLIGIELDVVLTPDYRRDDFPTPALYE